MPTFNDPLFSSQWHFQLLGNIDAVWNEFSGAGIRVGVYDDGIQFTHPDLDGRYDASLHFTSGGVIFDPTPITLTGGFDADGHGTSVAGIIAAEAGNGIGGVGVAWGASVTGVNLLSDPRFDGQTALGPGLVLESFRHAARFDVMSNSWGFEPFFYSILNRGDAGSYGAEIVAAFGDAVATGRGGLGTVIVKAAGNEAFNANGEGVNGSRFVIDVAALSADGQITSYSNYGTNILVSAGAASVTTDLLGANGYNAANGAAGNYTSGFGGTSAATPVVSGVVALMLDANEGLGWRDVREILATSAALTGSVVTGTENFEVTGTAFQRSAQGGDSWNDSGRAYSQDYGFGRVDAYAAVRMAEIWSLFGAPQNSGNEEHRTISQVGPVAIYHNGTTGIMSSTPPTLTIGEHFRIEHIDLSVRFDLPASLQDGEIEFSLLAPDGTAFKFLHFFDEVAAFATTGFTWTFGIAHALGMDAFGNWSLSSTVRDTVSFNPTIVNLQNFSLDFYGSGWDVNNVHHITKDFLLVDARSTSSFSDRVINDINGGVDWINMSTIAGGVTATLDALGRITVGGTQWATIATAGIENIVTGDGADALTGSALANQIHGMRGNDTLSGLGGDDTLKGGSGNDQLLGGDDNDLLDGGIGADTIYGGAGADRITEQSGGGNDVVYAGTGRDTVNLGAGNDIFHDEVETGPAGGDVVTGGDGNDTMYGSGGGDRLAGDAGNDLITGGQGDDTLTGGLGLDTLDAGIGNDLVQGGDGDDRIIGGEGFDRLFGDAGHDSLVGAQGNDTLAGGIGNDTLTGGAGNDSLRGEAGNDRLDGGIGLDLLSGGIGDDILTGGLDADTFLFLAGFGVDQVTDFADNIDTLSFTVGLWQGFSDTVAFVDTYAQLVGLNVIFDFENGNVLTISGAQSLAILYDDISFV